MLTIMASLAQQESQSLSQNVKMSLQCRYRHYSGDRGDLPLRDEKLVRRLIDKEWR
jgi:uncharacterized ubiquitin-like protein YukD